MSKHKNRKVKVCRIKGPPYVLLSSAIPTHACDCCYHENFMLLLDELCKVSKTIPTYSE